MVIIKDISYLNHIAYNLVVNIEYALLIHGY